MVIMSFLSPIFLSPLPLLTDSATYEHTQLDLEQSLSTRSLI